MFSGIVEEIGIVHAVTKKAGLLEISIQAKKCLEDINRGDSLSVNGVCLTVCAVEDQIFLCEVIPETCKRSNLGGLEKGSWVNIERSLSTLGRIGGHFVQGHVDGTTCIVRREQEGEAQKLWLKKPAFWRECFIPKGFICLDGVSLTLVDCTESEFSVCFIPFTQKHTIFGYYNPESIINVEIDQISKTIAQIMTQRMVYAP